MTDMWHVPAYKHTIKPTVLHSFHHKHVHLCRCELWPKNKVRKIKEMLTCENLLSFKTNNRFIQPNRLDKGVPKVRHYNFQRQIALDLKQGSGIPNRRGLFTCDKLRWKIWSRSQALNLHLVDIQRNYQCEAQSGVDASERGNHYIEKTK